MRLTGVCIVIGVGIVGRRFGDGCRVEGEGMVTERLPYGEPSSWCFRFLLGGESKGDDTSGGWLRAVGGGAVAAALLQRLDLLDHGGGGGP